MLRLFFICIFKCSLKKKYYYIEEFRTQREMIYVTIRTQRVGGST